MPELGCNCGKNRAQWQVVTADGKTVFTGNKPVAQQVAKRYPGAQVKEATPQAR